jgi:hypothetical protein
MATRKAAQVSKPSLHLDTAGAMAFATESPRAVELVESQRRVSREASGAVSGLVPANDVRLTANIKKDLHAKLKHAAVDSRTTVGELIEAMVVMYLDKDFDVLVKVIEKSRKESAR